MQPKIVHFIYSLGRGGAETMLVRVINELTEYDHIVVTLCDGNHFGNEIQNARIESFGMKSLLQLPVMMQRFRKLLLVEKPVLVHSHLFWPNFVARLAMPASLPLVTTIHMFIKSSADYKRWYVRALDRFSFHHRPSTTIVVAKGALDEYFEFQRSAKTDAHVLYTFVDVNKFQLKTKTTEATKPFRIIAVGALRHQKNYPYLVQAMQCLKNEDIEVDIYGIGDKHEEIEKLIAETGAKVNLKGQVANIQDVIADYDLFLLPSLYEGFSLAVLEAMAMKIPLLLSDIKSFKEQCEDTAWYFSLNDAEAFASKIKYVAGLQPAERGTKAEQAYTRVIQHFTFPKHVEGLRKIYHDILRVNS